MRFKASILSVLLMVCFVFQSAAQINYQGKDYWINGVNIAWNKFGTDAGAHYMWGEEYDADYFETCFQQCNDYGVNTVRLWLHCDGRSSPEFDGNDYVTGIDASFFTHLDDIFYRAEQHGIMVILCLWSFDMLKDYSTEAGIYAGNHQQFITDTARINSYLRNALIPIVERYANQCNLLAYDIINEPEWCIIGNPTAGVVTQIDYASMQRFVGLQAAAIHQHSDKMVTVGSASLKWHSFKLHSIDHYWTDARLKAATFNSNDAYLDFYTVHYWDWMYRDFSPWEFEYAYWWLDKPTVLGEVPGEDGIYSTFEMIEQSYHKGWAGVMPWSYNGFDDYGEWDNFKYDLLYMEQSYPYEIIFDCNPLSVNDEFLNDVVTVFYDGTNINVKSDVEMIESVSIFDVNGALVYKEQSNTLGVSINISAAKGLYLVEVKCTSGVRYSKKLIL